MLMTYGSSQEVYSNVNILFVASVKQKFRSRDQNITRSLRSLEIFFGHASEISVSPSLLIVYCDILQG